MIASSWSTSAASMDATPLVFRSLAAIKEKGSKEKGSKEKGSKKKGQA
jgi:hypothetical protein